LKGLSSELADDFRPAAVHNADGGAFAFGEPGGRQTRHCGGRHMRHDGVSCRPSIVDRKRIGPDLYGAQVGKCFEDARLGDLKHVGDVGGAKVWQWAESGPADTGGATTVVTFVRACPG